MNGKSLWGNISLAPNQDRLSKKKKLSIVVIHDVGKLSMLYVLRSLFRGKHISLSSVELLTGHNITVESNLPTPFCMDGELDSNVTKYQVQSAAL